MSAYAGLSAYQRWMVKSNLQRIDDEGLNFADVAANLRANGYSSVGDAVEELRTLKVTVFAVTATVGRTVMRSGLAYNSTRQVPTFYLRADVQGLLSEDDACRVARRIINPLDDEDITVNVTAVPV